MAASGAVDPQVQLCAYVGDASQGTVVGAPGSESLRNSLVAALAGDKPEGVAPLPTLPDVVVVVGASMGDSLKLVVGVVADRASFPPHHTSVVDA